jgi:hypothetical protein
VEEAGRQSDGLPVLHYPGGDVNLTVLVGGFRGHDEAWPSGVNAGFAAMTEHGPPGI